VEYDETVADRVFAPQVFSGDLSTIDLGEAVPEPLPEPVLEAQLT
jgi:hypothetical protein